MRAVNPNIQPEAQRVLDYLESIRGTKIILGQHTQTIPQEELAHIKEVTGKLPALCGFELLAYSPNIRPELSGEECMEEVRLARGTLRKAWDWAKLGGLITFTWHWFSPMGGKDKSFFSVNTDFSAEKAAQASTPENIAFINDLDYMAGLLRPFCDEHIPILWRPFHEAEGDWFWWSHDGTEPCKILYRIMFERFVNKHHLDNLIWVHNSPKAVNYPGDDVVDIISRDLYPPEHQHTDLSKEYTELRAVTSADKLCAVAEIGTIPDIPALTEHHVPWCWYMTWSHDFCTTERFTTSEELCRAYNCENAVTLNKLPHDLYKFVGNLPFFIFCPDSSSGTASE